MAAVREGGARTASPWLPRVTLGAPLQTGAVRLGTADIASAMSPTAEGAGSLTPRPRLGEAVPPARGGEAVAVVGSRRGAGSPVAMADLPRFPSAGSKAPGLGALVGDTPPLDGTLTTAVAVVAERTVAAGDDARATRPDAGAEKVILEVMARDGTDGG